MRWPDLHGIVGVTGRKCHCRPLVKIRGLPWGPTGYRRRTGLFQVFFTIASVRERMIVGSDGTPPARRYAPARERMT